MTPSPVRRATLDDFWAIPEAERFHEIIDGEILPKATPSAEHGDAQAGVIGVIRSPFQRAPGRGGPGGWWILTEVEVLLGGTEIVRPDVVGWRRDRCPERPSGIPVRQRPDWICEVVSPSNAKNDTLKKLRLYHHSEIGHYWIVDPREATLTVMRWSADGYVTLMRAERGETVRPEPFQQIELAVGTLFGDDPPER
ncbi:MAG TPA: Uma2 family endonuclease [Kofleriaceae bacterium]|nr:Uma2 family endonuclease [Kofleriaceae bacterium]